MSQNVWSDILAARPLAPDGESFGDLSGELAAARDGSVLVPLTDYAAIRASGEDAAEFLHNLLSNDVKNLPADGLRFAGLCSPKGRLLATFHIWHDGPDLLLVLSADIQPAILKKLSMYILRSKVKLTDANLALLGIAGPGAADVAREALGTVPEATHVANVPGGQVVGLGGQRYLVALDPSAAVAAWPRLAAKARPAGTAAWRWTEIAAGQPRVVAATQEAFVPQMVNMEVPAVGGVSFSKGCYPGQEIVARTQYLGKIKRRMYRASVDTALPPGTDVFTPESGEQHCGALVTVAPSPDGRYECLVVVQSSGAEAGEIFAGGPGVPPRLTLGTLPYTID
ncbi:MAG: folate-binding protein YgfZ [Rhodocyclales bacterium]|nr:folate-binding protein YgfZ [Rhodocyclales bacterium]